MTHDESSCLDVPRLVRCKRTLTVLRERGNGRMTMKIIGIMKNDVHIIALCYVLISFLWLQ